MKNKKSLGQHWLKNREILNEIASLSVVAGVETCLEIGPGLGTLTSSLLKHFSKVIAIEFDPTLAANLPKSFPGKNLQVINNDILKVDIAKTVSNAPYVVSGNIPYYITSPIIHKLLSSPHVPAKIILLIQKEVAERIAAEPGDYNLLALSVQNVAEVELGPLVPAIEFTPPPKVDSQIIMLTPLSEPQIPPECLDLARKGFSSPRKKLCANLSMPNHSKTFWRETLSKNGINPDARAEDLSLWDWEALYRELHQNASSLAGYITYVKIKTVVTKTKGLK